MLPEVKTQDIILVRKHLKKLLFYFIDLKSLLNKEHENSMWPFSFSDNGTIIFALVIDIFMFIIAVLLLVGVYKVIHIIILTINDAL